MKTTAMKLSILALAMVAFSNPAHATSVCNSGLYTTVAALNAGGGCDIGGILFSNFANLPTNVGVLFFGTGSATVDLVDDTVGNTGIQTFSGFTYTVTIDPSGSGITFSSVVAGVLDSGGTSTAQLNKLINGGTVPGVSDAVATDTSGVITNISVNGLSATTLNISDNFALISGNIANLANQYNTASAAPEPISMFLIGSGLVVVFFLPKKSIAQLTSTPEE